MREVNDGYVKHKRNDPMCDPWDSHGNEKKIKFLFLLLFSLTFLSEMKIKLPMNAKQKPFEIIFHVGRVTSLQSWVAKKSCLGQTLKNKCSFPDYPLKACNSPYMQMIFCFPFLGSYQ